MKITLTEEQINILTEKEKEILTIKYKEELKKLENKFNTDLENLKDKYKFFEIDIKTTKEKEVKQSTKQKIDPLQLTGLFNEGKKVKEMADILNAKEQTIRLMLNSLGLKLKDRN